MGRCERILKICVAIGSGKMAHDDLDISKSLQWNPKWHWDPVPWWFVERLDRAVLKEIAIVHLELQRDMLNLQTQSIKRTLEVISKYRGRL